MSPHKPTKVVSFGSLNHFRKENKPEGASERCWDCNVEKECPYSSKQIYYEPSLEVGRPAKFSRAFIHSQDIEDLEHHLKVDGNYGKCVYDSDNDVCDH